MPPPPVPIQAKIEPPKTPVILAASTGITAPTPTLKLKIGGNLAPRATPPTPSNTSTAPKNVITVKPKGRKPKPVETAPSPVVDDGSFDLLEEVIAIEKEKEKLVASKKQRQLTGPETVTPGKRKKDLLDELEEDEEILALASPSKKPSRSPQPASTEKEVRATSPGKYPGSIIKIKRPSISVPEPTANQEVKPPVENRQSSSKGKEREVASPAPTRPSAASAASETPMNRAKVREVLKNLLKLPEAALFSRPVDPVQDGCPTYLYLSVHVLVPSNAMLSIQIL
jgi:transcription initiation factor TFIID subunit 2